MSINEFIRYQHKSLINKNLFFPHKNDYCIYISYLKWCQTLLEWKKLKTQRFRLPSRRNRCLQTKSLFLTSFQIGMTISVGLFLRCISALTFYKSQKVLFCSKYFTILPLCQSKASCGILITILVEFIRLKFDGKSFEKASFMDWQFVIHGCINLVKMALNLTCSDLFCFHCELNKPYIFQTQNDKTFRSSLRLVFFFVVVFPIFHQATVSALTLALHKLTLRRSPCSALTHWSLPLDLV